MKAFKPPTRAPLATLSQSSQLNRSASERAASGTFAVLWRKPTNKKHKTWDGDGTLVVANGFAELQDDRGKVLGKTAYTKSLPEVDQELSLAGRIVQVESLLTTALITSSKHPPVTSSSRKPLDPSSRTPTTSSKDSTKRKRPASADDNATSTSASKIRKLSSIAQPPAPRLLPQIKFKPPVLSSTVLSKSSGPRDVSASV